MPGGRIDILVAPDVREFAGKLRSGLSPALGVAAGIGGALGLAVGGGVVAAFGQVIKIGNEFTVSLNTLKAVSGATAAQMEQVSARARQLGNDVSLPGTSANDAAAAMLELAKGGFTVQQSMDAARGSLQLAAAAGIDAAEAATIQSSALQAFGLQADQAGRVADVLANTANASSAEITDVAYAMQSGAAVAHGFGLTVEDTAAAIGLLANSGIKGSDAGTLLKSALLALTDQGKPAQAAIAQLGLTVYDAQGRFVGLHSLFEQLDAAAGRMTDQQYQAATATLFGSDAMRLSSIAAEKGAAGFDQMRAAMGRQGSAAEVAAAKMQGLPGAMQQAQNAAEGLALEVYDLVKGPLEQFTKNAASAITTATPYIVDGLHNAADAAVGFGQGIAPAVKAAADLPTPVLAAAAALVAFRTTGIGPALSTQVSNGTSALRGFGEQMAVQRNLAAASGESITRAGAAIATLEARVPVVARMGEAYRNASTQATVFARTQGTVAAASSGVRSAASGVVGMLGGPWALALTGGVAALTANIEASQSARSAQRALADAAAAGARAQADFGKAVAAANGALSDQALGAGNAAVQSALAEIVTLGERGHKPMEELGHQIDNITGNVFGSNDAWEKNYDKVTASEEQYNALRKVMGNLQIDLQGVGQIVTQGGPAYDNLIIQLQRSGDAGKQVAQTLIGVHDQLAQTATAAQNASPGFFDLTAAVKILADQSSSATDRVNAMKTALEVLSGKPVAVQDALARYNEQVRATAAATEQAWDRTQGFGDALVGEGGQVNTASANGQKLYETLTRMRDATITAAEAGANMDPILQQNGYQFQQLATATGLSADQVRTMAEQLGLLPKYIEILAQLKGADTVEQQLVAVKLLLDATGGGATIPVNALTDEAKKQLEELGVKVEAVNGKPGSIRVSTEGQPEAMRKLDELINKKLPDKVQKVVLDYDQEKNRPEGFIGPIAPQPVTPRAEGGIDNLPGQATIWSPQTRYYQVSEPETGGEAFIPLAESKRSRSVDILSAVAERFGFGLTKMANGGITAVDRTLTFLRGESGKQYQYGGVGNPSWDCSGFISAAYALLRGLDPRTRWFTTESDFASLGFRTGLDPTGRGLNIGVYRGGGGQYSHMAGDLAGVPLESGGNGVQVGAGAQSASSSNLPLKFYLPGTLFSPPDDGSRSRSSRSRQTKKTWDQSDELELESARLNRSKQQSQLEETLKDPKKSPDDKRQAQIDVEQADLRIQQLEKKRDEANSTGGPVTPAPPLEGNLTDDQIRLEELQMAVRQAQDERDDTYNDPEATPDERRQSDLALAKAMNAVVAEQKKQRDELNGASGSGGSSPVQLLGEVAKSAVTGAVGELLQVVGLGGDIQGVGGALITLGAEQAKKGLKKDKPTPAQYSDEDIAKQGPVVPGTPGWFEQLLKTFQVPTFIRDQGGPLPTGTAALNLSGRDEWVLSPEELQAARSPAALGQLAARTVIHQSIDGRTVIERLTTGMSAGEFRREMRMIDIDKRDRVAGLVPRR
ncbi:phage tail tape measure protein [Nocardia wallacei]|uniref:phage tail tape measure protein n=1 Tax=Nocardia wallacei TaxID=480035 RepID=UPI002456B785|nr:phage tail tape measure protein [Nocardia wallacei]